MVRWDQSMVSIFVFIVIQIDEKYLKCMSDKLNKIWICVFEQHGYWQNGQAIWSATTNTLHGDQLDSDHWMKDSRDL